jgi:uncharacterized protein YndB with AHSA1/START domain
MKEKLELEYLLKTSPKVFESMVSTPSGLAEWFADDVNVDGDIYTFHWDGSEEKARLLNKKPNSFIRWKWLSDESENEETYFEISYQIDPMTKSLVLKITDFAEKEDTEEIKMLWESQIVELRRILGS